MQPKGISCHAILCQNVVLWTSQKDHGQKPGVDPCPSPWGPGFHPFKPSSHTTPPKEGSIHGIRVPSPLSLLLWWQKPSSLPFLCGIPSPELCRQAGLTVAPDLCVPRLPWGHLGRAATVPGDCRLQKEGPKLREGHSQAPWHPFLCSQAQCPSLARARRHVPSPAGMAWYFLKNLCKEQGKPIIGDVITQTEDSQKLLFQQWAARPKSSSERADCVSSQGASPRGTCTARTSIGIHAALGWGSGVTV